jgi:hypothetical protein
MKLDKYGQVDIATQLKQAVLSKNQALIDSLSAQRDAKILSGGDKYKDVQSTSDYLKSLGWNTDAANNTANTPVNNTVSTPSFTDYTPNIQSMYDARLQGTIAGLGKSRDLALGRINESRSGLAPR